MPPGDNGTGYWSEGGCKGFEALVRRAQADDRDARNRICLIIQPHVLKFAMAHSSFARAVDSAEDLAQQALISICEGIGTFEGGSDDEQTFKMFWCWSRTLTKRICFNAERHRRQKRRSPGRIRSLEALKSSGPSDSAGDEALHSKHTTPYTATCRAERRRKIQEAMVAVLDDREADVVRLNYFEGFSLVEVADILRLDYEEVRSIRAAADRKLQRALRDLE